MKEIDRAKQFNKAAEAMNEHDEYRAAEPILFYMEPWKPGEPIHKGVCSQWAPTPFSVAGADYPTAEHYMMACKASYFGDDKALRHIMGNDNPGYAKSVGRQVRGYVDAEWAEERFAVVARGNYYKFCSTPRLCKWLLDTGTGLIVEASCPDQIWGIGLSTVDARATNPTLWQGSNLLGFAIMAARDMLRREYAAYIAAGGDGVFADWDNA